MREVHASRRASIINYRSAHRISRIFDELVQLFLVAADLSVECASRAIFPDFHYFKEDAAPSMRSRRFLFEVIRFREYCESIRP